MLSRQASTFRNGQPELGFRDLDQWASWEAEVAQALGNPGPLG
jgi:hypothetical protein